MVVQIVLARLISPADFGLIAVVVVFVNLATVFVQGGLNTALVQDSDAGQKEFSTVFWLSISIAVVLYVILFCASPLIQTFYSMSGLADVLRVLGVLLFVNAFGGVQVAYLQKKLEMKAQFLATTIASVASGALGIFSAILGAGVWALVIQTLLQQVVTCLVVSLRIRWVPSLCFDFRAFKRLWGFGWKLLAASLLHTIYMGSYDLIVGKIFSATDLGYFSQGKKYPAQIESVLDSAISSVALPAASMLKDSRENLKAFARRGLQVSAATIIPIMTAIGTCAYPVIGLLLGEEWSPAAPFFAIFCIDAALAPISRINLQCINAVGRSDIFLKLEVQKKTIAIFVIVLAAVSGSLILLALSSIVYAVIALVLNMYPSKRLFGFGILEQAKTFAGALGISCISALPSLAFGVMIDMWALAIVVQLASFAISYIGLSLLLRSDAFLYTCNLLGDFLKARRARGGQNGES